VEGRFANDRVLPVNTKMLHYSATDGTLDGNSLWIPFDFKPEKVTITVKLKDRPSVTCSMTLYVKIRPDDEKLKTAEEILQEMRQSGSKRPDSSKKSKKKRNR
jgi:hypothetical protein